MAEGERLLAAGEVGLARLELEAALAIPGLTAIEAEHARQLLRASREALARARLVEARARIEAGDADGARSALELAASLADEIETRNDIERARADAVAAESAAETAKERKRRAPEESAEVDDGDAGEGGDAEPGEAPLGSEGEDELSRLELALLAQPAADADQLRALAAADPSIGEALALAYEGDHAAAVAQFARTAEAAASDPLVQREHARAALGAGAAPAAVRLLEAARSRAPTDVVVLELLVEARLQTGVKDGAAEIARDLLDRGLARDFAGAVLALAEGGHGDEALRHVDRVLDREPRLMEVWELRATLCGRAGDRDAVREADEQAIEIFHLQLRTDPDKAALPLASARRLAEELEGRLPEGAEGRRKGLDLLRQLVARDPEHKARWRELLARLAA
jgi:tetratricopeptide (TPR) repeat protein